MRGRDKGNVSANTGQGRAGGSLVRVWWGMVRVTKHVQKHPYCAEHAPVQYKFELHM